jgi:hypothetical protein
MGLSFESFNSSYNRFWRFPTINLWPVILRASPCKPLSNVLNRESQILFNLIHAVEVIVLWILVHAVSKNTESSIWYDFFAESPKD